MPVDPPSLVGTVGPGFTITLQDASGNPVKHLDVGSYTLLVHDRSDLHNFHLAGAGGAVNVSTDIEFVGDQTFTLDLVDGRYSFVCDAHVAQMIGDFTVGTVAAPPPPPKPKPAARLYAVLSAAGKASLGARPGARAKSVKAGAYSVSVKDASRNAGFRLSGPRVSRSTGRAFTGSVTWKVTLQKGGVYRYGPGLSVKAS